MAAITKPTDINKIWAASGDILAPSDSKISTGWQVEIPPRQYFNYIDNKQDKAIAHINQMGIAVWDNTTEYQYNVSGIKSLCMGSDGTIYRALQTHQNQNPVSTTGYWEIAFSSAGDFYTQTESDARYTQKSANLSDLTNPATARTNLSVYSQAQTYTKTEVDNKTTVASVLQSQQQLLDTVLLSPIKLGYAFHGANQQTGINGFQKLPGGVVIQWGTANINITSTGGSTTISFPMAFPNACGAIVGSYRQPSVVADCLVVNTWIVSASQATISLDPPGAGSPPTGAQTAFWMAIGY
jgi:hypothetical protein